MLAAPVILCQERCRLDSLRAVVVNSGNANAATGRRGVDDAARMQGAAAMAVGLDPEVVAVASTGVIGVPLPADPIIKGILAARGDLAPDGDERFGDAIRTTDLFPKRATVDVTLPSGTVRITAQAKGAGMISPNFATMLCFVQTDAALAPETADLLLGVCVKRSFDRISVDGQLSTNDTAILMASGASGVRIEPESEDEVRFGEALDAVLRRLARADRARRRGREARRARRGQRRPRADRRRPPRARWPTRRSSRRRCTAAIPTGAASPRRSAARSPAPRRCRSTSGSRTSTSARGGAALPFDLPALAGGGLRRGGRVHGRPARRGRRDRGLLLRPLARLRDDQRGVHDMRDVGTLLEALPYIREFHGKTVVIKYGGAAMTDPDLREEFARDVVLLKYVGLNPIVVHGGGPDITPTWSGSDMPVEFVGGLRVSDADTVEIAKMVLVGKVNKDIVLRINRHGQPAVGLCGDDGLLFRVAKTGGPEGEDIGYVGRIERVDVGVIEHIAADYIPVIASVGADREGSSHNVNADEAAGAVARALGAYKVMFLTDVAGWLRDAGDPESVISECAADEVEAALDGVAGGMRPKLRRLPRRDPRRRHLRAHHRRPRAALPAARAVHRRGDRHEGAAGAVSGALIPNYARYDVEFERGEGVRLWDADGPRVPRLPVRDRGLQHRPLPSARRRRGAGAGGAAAARLEPLLHGADGAARRAAGGVARWAARSTSANSGAEANEAALKLARKRRPGGRFVVLHGGFHGRTFGALSATPQETKQAPFAPLVPGFDAVLPAAAAGAVDGQTGGRGARADPGRVGRAPAATRSSWPGSAPRATSTARC